MTAIFPGSFDPFTLGHHDVVRRGALLFDEVIVGVGYNKQKNGFLTVDARVRLIEQIFKAQSRVRVVAFEGLTVDYCRENGIKFILRSVRNTADLEYERTIADVNRRLEPSIESVLLISSPEYAAVSSSIVRELYYHEAPVAQFLSDGVNLEDFK
ncbi:MAG: pantetheine-phosphate adenylyltransferase [Mucinivorans sp.]